MAVRMELSRIFIREMTAMQIIELSELDGERTFPIVIGLPEAFAIERRLKGIFGGSFRSIIRLPIPARGIVPLVELDFGRRDYDLPRPTATPAALRAGEALFRVET